jgi:hypothetical protein
VVREVAVDEVPTVESLFVAVVAAAGARAAAAVRVAVVPAAGRVAVVEVDVLGVAVLVAAAGRLAEAVVVAVFPGLDMRVLVRRAVAAVAGFFSSSLALMLGRLRWLTCEVAVVGRRTVEVDVVGGRVGGLLSPPVARLDAVAAVAVLEAVVAVAPGRRAVAGTVVVPGRLTPAAAVDEVAVLGLGLVSGSGVASGCS